MILTVRAEGNLCGAGVYVNGKRLKFKNTGKANGIYGASEAKTEVDGQAEISVIKRSPFGYKKWFWRVAVFWLSGIFGLFTPRYKKQVSSLDCKFKAELKDDSSVVLRVNPPNFLQQSAKPVIAVSEIPLEEENNCWFNDMAAKKRRKFYHIFNAFFWILLAVAVALTFILISK